MVYFVSFFYNISSADGLHSFSSSNQTKLINLVSKQIEIIALGLSGLIFQNVMTCKKFKSLVLVALSNMLFDSNQDENTFNVLVRF